MSLFSLPFPLKRVVFRVHWIAGLAAGLVLGVVGFSGGLLGFEDWIVRALNPQFQIAADGRNAQLPAQWIESARTLYTDRQPRSLIWNGAGAALAVRMARGNERGSEVALDPYTGSVLASARGTEFFKTVESVHRSLAGGPLGKQIVGASTALLIVMALSGVYLRWPRRPLSVSALLRLDFRLKGRGFLWHLHAVTGTWLLAFYLVAASTGLWWSYDFYRSAVNRIAGVTTPQRRSASTMAATFAVPLSIDKAWEAFRQDVPDATRASIVLSGDTTKPVEIRYQTPASAHERAWNALTFDGSSGALISRALHSDQPRGRRFVTALFPLHSGSFFGATGRVLMALASLLLPLFALTGIWLWLLRRRSDAARLRQRATAVPTSAVAAA